MDQRMNRNKILFYTLPKSSSRVKENKGSNPIGTDLIETKQIRFFL